LSLLQLQADAEEEHGFSRLDYDVLFLLTQLLLVAIMVLIGYVLFMETIILGVHYPVTNLQHIAIDIDYLYLIAKRTSIAYSSKKGSSIGIIW
jgi:hypothetical protein